MIKVTKLSIDKNPIPTDQPVEAALFDPFGDICTRYTGFSSMLAVHQVFKLHGELGQAKKYKEIGRELSAAQFRVMEGVENSGSCNFVFSFYRTTFANMTWEKLNNEMKCLGGIEIRLKSDPTQTARWYFTGAFKKDSHLFRAIYDKHEHELEFFYPGEETLRTFATEYDFQIRDRQPVYGTSPIPDEIPSETVPLSLEFSTEKTYLTNVENKDAPPVDKTFHLEIASKKFDIPTSLFDTVVVKNEFDISFIKTV